MKKVMDYFGIGVSQFKKEWMELSAQDKADLISGVESGSLTY